VEKPFPNSGVTRRLRTLGRLELMDARHQYMLLVIIYITTHASNNKLQMVELSILLLHEEETQNK